MQDDFGSTSSHQPRAHDFDTNFTDVVRSLITTKLVPQCGPTDIGLFQIQAPGPAVPSLAELCARRVSVSVSEHDRDKSNAPLGFESPLDGRRADAQDGGGDGAEGGGKAGGDEPFKDESFKAGGGASGAGAAGCQRTVVGVTAHAQRILDGCASHPSNPGKRVSNPSHFDSLFRTFVLIFLHSQSLPPAPVALFGGLTVSASKNRGCI